MDSMQSQEQDYLDPPEHKARCESCQTILKNGRCSNCEMEYNSDDEVDRYLEDR